MINYTEKGGGLHVAINDAGYTLKANTNDEAYDAEGNQSTDIDTAVQAIIDAYDPLDATQQEALKTLSDYASELITNDNKPLIGRGRAANFRARVFTQFNIEEATILAETNWQLVNVNAAKANLDAIV